MASTFTSYRVEDRSFVAYIKREIHSLVAHAKFPEKQRHEIDIIVSELSSNLIKHAGSGELVYRITSPENALPTFEIISIDNGPGIVDIVKVMKDGISTAGTLGHGLGAIDRLSTLSQVYSLPKWGTIHYAMVGPKKRHDDRSKKNGLNLDIAALCVNKPREAVCGDGYRVKETETEIQIFFGDGLGHGEHAKEAVEKAGNYFLETKASDPVDIIREMHEKVRRTRGLVAVVAVWNKKTSEWKLCGVGNILARMYSGIQSRNYMSYNGTVGMNIPNTINNSVFAGEKNQHLILCSDGIRTRWDLGRFHTIFRYDVTVLASAIYKDFSRGNDDASVLIAKVI